jgi:hypothetical protein
MSSERVDRFRKISDEAIAHDQALVAALRERAEVAETDKEIAVEDNIRLMNEAERLQADLASARQATDLLNERQRVEWARAETAEASLAAARQWVDDLQSGMFVNCVYCGHRYGPGETTPVSMADALKAHVEQCPEHPMSALRQRAEGLERVVLTFSNGGCYCYNPRYPSTPVDKYEHDERCVATRAALGPATCSSQLAPDECNEPTCPVHWRPATETA